MAHLNLDLGLLAYNDQPVTNAPILRSVDWRRSFRGLRVDAPGATSGFEIAPGASATLFEGVRTITASNSTTYSLTLSPLSPTQYFLTWTGGTAPGFRTDRGLTLAASTVAVSPVGNQDVTFSITAGGGNFTGVQVGDQVFIPGVTTGDAPGPFNPNNEGLWVVISITDSTDIVLARPPNSTLGFFAQTGVVLSNNLQFQAFSSAGVQVGDQVDISAGVPFPSPLLNTFNVLAVTAQRLTIQSTNPLPLLASFTPTAAGLTVYSQAFNLVYLEANQECVVQTNGDTGSTQRVAPLVTTGRCQCRGDAMPGMYLKTGPTWELAVTNLSVNTLHVTLITVASA